MTERLTGHPAPARQPSPSKLPPAGPAARLPLRTKVAVFLRLLAIQGSWNYELLMGTGIGFCAEPALRRLPGGQGGAAYREALAREAQYFNAHPYLASIAVGALIRAELDGVPPAQIERFRTALCGPLGSVGDRLVWAGWLPFSSLLALAAYGLGARAGLVLLIFLGVYNVGHLGLRAWGLTVGWRHGMRVAAALGTPVLRQGPTYIARVAAVIGGAALPLVLKRTIGSGHVALGVVILATLAAAAVLERFHGRIEGWRIAFVVLLGLAIYSVAR